MIYCSWSKQQPFKSDVDTFTVIVSYPILQIKNCNKLLLQAQWVTEGTRNQSLVFWLLSTCPSRIVSSLNQGPFFTHLYMSLPIPTAHCPPPTPQPSCIPWGRPKWFCAGHLGTKSKKNRIEKCHMELQPVEQMWQVPQTKPEFYHH